MGEGEFIFLYSSVYVNVKNQNAQQPISEKEQAGNEKSALQNFHFGLFRK